ncbi:MAG: hypothetical protein WBP41_08340 [Saprospiraceae bacterium]
MLEENLKSIKKLREELNEGSCIKKEPFIKLGEGKAPTLNYNIPQSACFNTFGYIFVKGIKQEWFMPRAKEKPKNNYFDVVKACPKPLLQIRFAEAIQMQRTDDPLIINSYLFRKQIDLSKSDLSRVSLAKYNYEPKSPYSKINPELIKPLVVEKSNAVNELQLAELAKEGLRPMFIEKLGGYESKLKFIKEPTKCTPYFAVIEEYTTCSFLGDYGAGRTIKTFSLLPGEKTTISIKTYKDISSVKSYSENVLDSFSESSTNELERNIENEVGFSDSTTTGSSDTSTNTKSGKVGGNVGVSILGIINIGANGGYDEGSSSTNTNSFASTRASNVRSVNKALDKHVSTSNSNRSIEINTSTTETFKEGEETSTIRELININKSRVLNFAFRQLLQQYITVTYLSNLKIVFCNGYQESLRAVDLEELDKLLEDTIKLEHIETVRSILLKNYCKVWNFEDKPIPFVEKVEYQIGECVDINETEKFWRVKKDIADTFKFPNGGLEIKVKGPILNVNTHTLKTSSMVVDAFLGQGEALDCFNMKAQDSVAIGEQLKNLETLQRLELIENVSDNDKRVEMYKKVFGSCCDAPQTQIIP